MTHAVVAMSAFGFRYAHENPFSYEFSCGVCSRVTSEEDLDGMIVCEGGCKKIFHTDCVGLSALPDGSASKWACSRCIQRLRACHICDGLELKSSRSSLMVRCEFAHCGKWYHTSCLELKYGGKCPLHECAISTCSAVITDECYFCAMCLKAYHLKCMPEAVEVICENTCLCLDHQFVLNDEHSRSVDIWSRLRGVDLGRKVISKFKKLRKLEDKNSSDVVLVGKSEKPKSQQDFIALNFSVPFKVSDLVSDEHIILSDDELALTKRNEEAQDKSGLDFIRLRTNEWVCMRPKQRSEEMDCFTALCACDESSNFCSQDCTNRICMVQCDSTNCRPTVKQQQKQIEKKKTSFFQCGNKPFTRGAPKSGAKYKIESAQGKGMGLVVKSKISAGEFIVEYIGEVLTVDGWAERQKESSGSTRHFYVMDLDGGSHVVDASRKGNDSRLINHSCDPNLETQKWTVNGESRIGLFALRDILPNEELTFNYQFETFASKPFKCLCKTAQCTGWIGGKKKVSAKDEKTENKKNKPETALFPLSMLSALASADIHISGTRTDGTRKREEEIAQEEISACKVKVDFFLQYIWAGCMSAEEWVAKGRLCASLFPEATMHEFNPAAILALSVTKLEAAFIRERNLLVLRTLNKARREMARRFYVWESSIFAVEKILETNWISDEICTRCRRTGNLIWCKTCIRSFHQFCTGGRDSSVNGTAFTCRRCRRLKQGELPPIRLATKSLRSSYWKKRRSEYWNEVVLPSLALGN